jgi:16S rRNA (uracil1498-N3)-methyltransferase
MELFFAGSTDGDELVLSREESHHAIHVKRKKAGDAIYITDGKGSLVTGLIRVADSSGCTVEVTARHSGLPAMQYTLHIAVSPTKNIDRFEWFIEKATEVGITQITPVIAARSERRHINADRLNKLMIAAAKQSGRVVLPVVNPMISFADLISGAQADICCIAHCNEPVGKRLKDIYSRNKSWCILIGPEGDFTPDEVKAAALAGFEPVSLGSFTLRSETAALMACCTIAVLNG